MNGRMVLLLAIGGLLVVALFIGDDLIRPLRDLGGGDHERALDEGALLSADGEKGEEGPALEGRGGMSGGTGGPGAGRTLRLAADKRSPATGKAVGTRFTRSVRGPGESSVGMVRLRLEAQDGRLYEFTSDARGRFDEKLPVGVYRATFLAEGVGALYLSALVVDGSEGGGQLDSLELQETLEVDVLVRRAATAGDESAAPQPLVGAEVTLVNLDAPTLLERSITGGDGVARFGGVLAARHEARVQITGGTVATHILDLRNEQRTFELRLPAMRKVSGRVTAGVDGPGVRDARVIFRVKPRRGEGEYETVAMTLLDGSFETEVPQGQGISLAVRAEGHAGWPSSPTGIQAANTALRALRGRRPVQLIAALEPGILLRGHFQAVGDGAALTGSITFTLRSTSGTYEASADTTGAFEVPDLSPGGYVLDVTAPGWSATNVRIGLSSEMAPSMDVGAVPIRATRRLQGRVLNAQGTPLPGARVWATYGLLDRNRESADLQTFTDTAGHWSLEGVLQGTPLALRASLGDQRSAPLGVATNQSDALDLRLQATGVLSGRLVDVVSDLPIGGVMLRAIPLDPRMAATAQTVSDASGAFTFSALLPGSWTLSVETPQYLPQLPRPVMVSTEKPIEAVVALDPGLVFAGVCQDEAGTPLSGAKVFLTGKRLDGRPISRIANTSGKGEFRISGLVEGTYRLRVLLSGYKMMTRSSLPQGDERMELILKR